MNKAILLLISFTIVSVFLVCTLPAFSKAKKELWVQYILAANVMSKRNDDDKSKSYCLGALSELEKKAKTGGSTKLNEYEISCLQSLQSLITLADVSDNVKLAENATKQTNGYSFSDANAIITSYDKLKTRVKANRIRRQAMHREQISMKYRMWKVFEVYLGKNDKRTISAKKRYLDTRKLYKGFINRIKGMEQEVDAGQRKSKELLKNVK